jgi:hypothetical protein
VPNSLTGTAGSSFLYLAPLLASGGKIENGEEKEK